MINDSFIRPARLSDLDYLFSFAKEAKAGITSLPPERSLLEHKLLESERAFQTKELTPHHETYIFCLEYNQEPIGFSGIVSRIGSETPFFAYHLREIPLESHCLNMKKRIPLLSFIKARKKPTEIGMLILNPAFRKKEIGKLLSFSRFLFMADFKSRFAPIVIAELRGFNDQEERSPFWDAIGRHFFRIDFKEANRLRAIHPECILELFPRSPIYPMLLPQEAQNVIGAIHPETLPAQKMLEHQGFKPTKYFDIFDAGPHYYSQTAKIESVRQSRVGTIREFHDKITFEKKALISNQKLAFRALVSPILVDQEEKIILPLKAGDYLKVEVGDSIRYLIL